MTLEDLKNAHFEPIGTQERLNLNVVLLMHQSVLALPAEQQRQQPWIEYGVWAAHLQKPPFLEGRHGAIRFPLTCRLELDTFMLEFGYLPLGLPATKGGDQ